MRVKTFEGRTLEELLPEIRSELGPDAVVLSQRAIVSGGVGGFFGKRMVQVTAADKMPSDDELVDLEQQFAAESEEYAPGYGQLEDLSTPAPATSGGSLDLTDDWDPSADEELAEEFGRVLESARDIASANQGAADRTAAPTSPAPSGAQLSDAGTYQPLALPARQATIAVPQASTATETPTIPGSPTALDVQARTMAQRAHDAIAAATREIESQLARETALPVTEQGVATFRAEVIERPSGPRLGFPSAEQASEDLAPSPVIADVAPVRTTPTVSERLQGEAARVIDELVTIGAERSVAEIIVGRAVEHRYMFTGGRQLRDIVRELVAETIRVESGWTPIGRAHRIAVVGPSGSGKSSVLAKLEQSYSRDAGKQVGVISLLAGIAGQTTTANDPLLSRGEVRVQFAADIDQTLAATQRFDHLDLTLIDTPSAAYLDPSARAAASHCLTAARPDEIAVVIPLTTSVREAESIVEHFRPMGVNRLIISKLDESRYAGQLLNFGYLLGLPITYLSDGPTIPEDLRAASSWELANLVVPPTEPSGPEQS